MLSFVRPVGSHALEAAAVLRMPTQLQEGGRWLIILGAHAARSKHLRILVPRHGFPSIHLQGGVSMVVSHVIRNVHLTDIRCLGRAAMVLVVTSVRSWLAHQCDDLRRWICRTHRVVKPRLFRVTIGIVRYRKTLIAVHNDAMLVPVFTWVGSCLVLRRDLLESVEVRHGNLRLGPLKHTASASWCCHGLGWLSLHFGCANLLAEMLLETCKSLLNLSFDGLLQLCT